MNNSVNSIFQLVSAIKCTLINFKVKYVLKFTMISQNKDFFLTITSVIYIEKISKLNVFILNINDKLL